MHFLREAVDSKKELQYVRDNNLQTWLDLRKQARKTKSGKFVFFKSAQGTLNHLIYRLHAEGRGDKGKFYKALGAIAEYFDTKYNSNVNTYFFMFPYLGINIPVTAKMTKSGDTCNVIISTVLSRLERQNKAYSTGSGGRVVQVVLNAK